MSFERYYEISKNKKPRKQWCLRGQCLITSQIRGAAGSRTPVQTRNQYAFYMFSLSLIVGK